MSADSKIVFSEDDSLSVLSFREGHKELTVASLLSGFYDLATVDTDGGNLQIFLPGTDGNYGHPRFSNDGKLLAFVAWRANVSSLLIYDFEGENILKKLDNVYPWFQYPSWASDSERVLFLTPDQRIATYSIKKDVVTVLDIKAESAIFHPEGKIFFVENKDAPRTLFSVNDSGSEKNKIIKRARLKWPGGIVLPLLRMSLKHFLKMSPKHCVADEKTQWKPGSGTPQEAEKKWESPPFRSLSGFSRDGRYLLVECGVMVLPGIRVETIEALDLKDNRFLIIHSGYTVGASW